MRVRPSTLRRLTRGATGPGIALVLAGATVLGGLAAPAQADRVVHRDARHDVRLTHEGRPGNSAARQRREPDITRTRITYGRDRLQLQVRLRGLVESHNHAALVQIDTPDFTAGVYVSRIPSRGLDSVVLVRGFGRVVDCAGLQFRMFFPKKVIKVVVPRSCLDDARWVRAGFALSWTTSRRALSDDALSNRLTGAATLTRRLYAG